MVRRDGLAGSRFALTSPRHESPLFNKYPRRRQQPSHPRLHRRALGMLSDGKLTSDQPGGPRNRSRRGGQAHHTAVGALSKTADALPGFDRRGRARDRDGTMGAINGPAEEIGHKVGTALAGTFLGIRVVRLLRPDGGPDGVSGIEMTFFRTIIIAVVALNEGATPRT